MNTKTKKKMTKKIISAFYKTELVEHALNECKDALACDNVYDFEEKIMHSVLLSEQNALSLRRFYIENIDNQVLQQDFKTRLCNAFDIKIFQLNDILSIEMPPLIHRSKQTENGKIVYNDGMNFPLAIALSEFKNKNKIPKIEEEVVIYVQNIVSNTALRTTIPDTDNYEYKDLINTITSVFLPDDNYKYVSLHHCSKQSQKSSKTLIKIIPKRLFAEFIAKELGTPLMPKKENVIVPFHKKNNDFYVA